MLPPPPPFLFWKREGGALSPVPLPGERREPLCGLGQPIECPSKDSGGSSGGCFRVSLLRERPTFVHRVTSRSLFVHPLAFRSLLPARLLAVCPSSCSNGALGTARRRRLLRTESPSPTYVTSAPRPAVRV